MPNFKKFGNQIIDIDKVAAIKPMVATGTSPHGLLAISESGAYLVYLEDDNGGKELWRYMEAQCTESGNA